MKKAITMVGTSIFNNYFERMSEISTHYNNIKEKSYTEYDEYKMQAEKVKRAVLNFYRNGYIDNISAEIKTISKMKAYLKEDLQIFLLASDTIVSYIAAEIIKELLIEEGFEVFFNPKYDVLRGLQVKDKEKFTNEGLHALIRRIESIAMGHMDDLAKGEEIGSGRSYYNNIVFNISGGYKACIPYLTVMAQINGCDMYYIFEDTEALIIIPPVPINIDVELFQKYSEEFAELERGIDGYNRWKKEHYNFVEQASSCIEVADDMAILSPLGDILWGNYKDRYARFYATKQVIKKMKNNKILVEKVLKFINKEIREAKTEMKGVGQVKHYAFDDGNNDYRILYHDKEGTIYIYEIFDSEEEQVDFLNTKIKSSNMDDYDYILCVIDKVNMEIKYKG